MKAGGKRQRLVDREGLGVKDGERRKERGIPKGQPVAQA